jgi:hypothetical protein
MPIEYIQLGAVFILAMSLIELVKYVVGKYQKSNGSDNAKKEATEVATALRIETANIASELKMQNENHLTHIGNDINIGFDRMCDYQQKCTDRMCQKLDMVIMRIRFGEIGTSLTDSTAESVTCK